ncbi:MAG: hypothetical protein IKM44_01915, partial [Clostridia bacterium]|nr:hypothetical protein [Clostridia bacterium]
MKKVIKLLSLLMIVCMLFCSCAQGVGELANVINNSITENNAQNNVVPSAGDKDNANAEQLSAVSKNESAPEKGTYNEGV